MTLYEQSEVWFAFYCDACDQLFTIPDETGHWKSRLERGEMPRCPDPTCSEDVVVQLAGIKQVSADWGDPMDPYAVLGWLYEDNPKRVSCACKEVGATALLEMLDNCVDA